MASRVEKKNPTNQTNKKQHHKSKQNNNKKVRTLKDVFPGFMTKLFGQVRRLEITGETWKLFQTLQNSRKSGSESPEVRLVLSATSSTLQQRKLSSSKKKQTKQLCRRAFLLFFVSPQMETSCIADKTTVSFISIQVPTINQKQ